MVKLKFNFCGNIIIPYFKDVEIKKKQHFYKRKYSVFLYENNTVLIF